MLIDVTCHLYVNVEDEAEAESLTGKLYMGLTHALERGFPVGELEGSEVDGYETMDDQQIRDAGLEAI